MAKPKVTSTDINSVYPPIIGGLATNTIASGWPIDNSYKEYREFIDYCTYGTSVGVQEPKEKKPKDDSPSVATMVSVIKNQDLTMRERVDKLVKKIIVNGPAIVVFWTDGTKTTVKCNEDFDSEKGLAMALIKRFFGNKGNYNSFIDFMMNKIVSVDGINTEAAKDGANH